MYKFLIGAFKDLAGYITCWSYIGSLLFRGKNTRGKYVAGTQSAGERRPKGYNIYTQDNWSTETGTMLPEGAIMTKKDNLKPFHKLLYFLVFVVSTFPNVSWAEWQYDWSTRTDREGKPAGIYVTMAKMLRIKALSLLIRPSDSAEIGPGRTGS